MSDIFLIYSSFSNKNEAISAAQLMIDEGLVACVNIIDHAISLYRWENTLQQEQEVIFFAKTTQRRLQEAMERLQSLHSYETPCIVAYRAYGGFAPYIQWVNREVRE